jgi:hypothetical protein
LCSKSNPLNDHSDQSIRVKDFLGKKPTVPLFPMFSGNTHPVFLKVSLVVRLLTEHNLCFTLPLPTSDKSSEWQPVGRRAAVSKYSYDYSKSAAHAHHSLYLLVSIFASVTPAFTWSGCCRDESFERQGIGF